MALVCSVDLEEAGLVITSPDRVPATMLASIFAITDQSQLTLTAIFGGHHQYSRNEGLKMTK